MMEFTFELIFEIYLELMMLIVPEEKTTTKKFRLLVVLFAVVVLLGVLALAVWGLVLLIDQQSLMGIIPLAIALALSLTQIVAGIVLFVRRNRR